MQNVVRFLASQNGRIVRIVAGLALILVGLLLGSTTGLVIAIVGAVPLLAGVLDVCVFAPLFGLPFRGQDIRR